MEAAIRLAVADDAEAIAVVYSHYVEHSHCTFEEVPPDGAEIGLRMSNSLYPWLLAEEHGRLLGYASSAPMRSRAAYRWSVETGIYLAPAARGRGWGGRLMAAHLAILTRQGFVTAVAGIALPNEASVALHEKLGFALIGVERGVGFKFGRWVDVARWQKDLAQRCSGPAEPLPYSAVASPAANAGFVSG